MHWMGTTVTKAKSIEGMLKAMGSRLIGFEELIASMKRCELIAGRRKVWDHLAELYSRTKGELLIMGEGADLSDKTVKTDFERLDQTMKEMLGARKRRNVIRVQTVDTWIGWISWLEEMLKAYPRRFTLLFTTERLKFVPQLNIRDKEEVVVVPPEESVDIAYALRIYGKDEEATNAIQSCCTRFSNLIDNSVKVRTSAKLNRLKQSLEAVKSTQVDLLIACEFQTQNKEEKTKFDKPQYRTIQQYFTLDMKVFRKISGSKLAPKYKEFRKRKCENLGDVLHAIYPSRYSGSRKKVDSEKMAGRIVKSVPNGLGVINPDLIVALLEDSRIRGSALDLSRYLSDSLFRVIQKF